MPFEPKIIGFLCTWCSYTGADTAGISRMKYPANLRAIRVPCSGRVSPELIMRTFDEGADGVLVLGCHIGECHYDTGNHRTAKRIPVLKSLMAFAGLEIERLQLDWVSASEGERFSRIVTEFTETIRALGPVHWKAVAQTLPAAQKLEKYPQQPETLFSLPTASYDSIAGQLQTQARELLEKKEVDCVIGYEVSPRGKTRPAFIYQPEDADKLTWNPECTHNLTVYLRSILNPASGKKPVKRVAVVVKACDSRAVNVMLTEGKITRDQILVLAAACEGIYEPAGSQSLTGNTPGDGKRWLLQSRCQECGDRVSVAADRVIGKISASSTPNDAIHHRINQLDQMTPAQRLDFWLSQFDHCIRCYACRQVCPMCDCPTCLFERDDSLIISMRNGLNEKRAFHLGRAFHLAGRCIGCNECERVCPMGIPISLLNWKIAQEIDTMFSFQAGRELVPPPFVTNLGEEQHLP